MINKKAVVLLVEDSVDDVELTLAAFEDSRLKVKIDVAKDGAEALDYLFKKGGHSEAPTPDVILLDLNLPKVSGLEVLKKVKNDPELAKIPVVVLTTSQDERDISSSYGLHANCFISKPVDFQQFKEVIITIGGFWFELVKLPGE
jgi:chemotaxis family two-component system response regulator Rcp1